jgi:hypothetical protein
MDSAPARLAEHLLFHRGRAFCDACLAFDVRLSLEEIRKLLLAVHGEIVLDRRQGACIVCGRQTSVVSAVAPAEDSPDHRVITFLKAADSRAQGVCHACIARYARLPYAEVRKTITRLRLTDVVLRVGTCAECRRYRMLVQPSATQGRTGPAGWPQHA